MGISVKKHSKIQISFELKFGNKKRENFYILSFRFRIYLKGLFDNQFLR